MRKLMLLWIFAAGGALGFVLSLALVSRASAAAATEPALGAAQFEARLTELDPALTNIAKQLRGKLTKGRLDAPERSVSWTARGGTAMTARVWLTDSQGKATLNTAIEARRDLEEMNQSFNLQYLGLQQQMQDENRRFTLISNIMKTKHDTAKNAISNIR